jgi:hypothetical protein|tara:strand:- start:6283 stop:8160 length:1878 start_codon:yes stop_codon:yes gene_type:complete
MADVTVTSTQLDFTEIKNKLKTYLAQDTQFSDYNFEASGLSNILDVLAYNTHFNALTANFALNESFLSTAQLRSSVVSHAATLGYAPRSRTASRAEVQLSINLNGVANRPSSVIIGAGTSFTSSVGDITYTYQTIEDYVATDNGSGLYQFLNTAGSLTIPLFEGTLKTKTFYVGEVGERQLYVIPDDTIDTSTAAVNVFDTTNGASFSAYTSINTAVSVTSTSRYYSINEAPNGYYELNFGDGISFGRAPVAGNKIVVSYLSCLGAEANGGSTFTPTSQVSVLGSGYNLSVTTITNSVTGAPKQSIESVRQNAPIAFAAQQRLVTADDYRAIIQSNFSTVTDAIAWGGEDNTPAEFGSVFVSLVFEDNTSAAAIASIKDQIVQQITNNLSIISIDTKFTDPTTTYLELVASFNFDPNLTGATIKSTEANVLGVINGYVSSNLKKFSGVFRRSELLAEIDDISAAILNSRVSVKLQQRFTPTLNVKTSYDIYFPNELAAPSAVDYTVTTSTFRFNGKVCSVKNKLNDTKLQIINSVGEVEVDNIGSFDNLQGKIIITGFAPTEITSGVTYLKVSAVPSNQSTVRPLRSYILDLDAGPTFATGIVDRQQTNIALGDGVGVISTLGSY